MTIKSKSGRMLESFTNTVIIKADFFHLDFIKKVSTVENVSRSLHCLKYLLIVDFLEAVPFSQNDDGMSSHSCLFS